MPLLVCSIAPQLRLLRRSGLSSTQPLGNHDYGDYGQNLSQFGSTGLGGKGFNKFLAGGSQCGASQTAAASAASWGCHFHRQRLCFRGRALPCAVVIGVSKQSPSFLAPKELGT